MSISATSSAPVVESDFIRAQELARLTPFELKTIYNQHSTQTGALAPILVKVGGRLGAWRADYEAWRDSQRRFVQEAS